MVKGEDGGQDRRVLALSVDAVPHAVHIGQDPVVHVEPELAQLAGFDECTVGVCSPAWS